MGIDTAMVMLAGTWSVRRRRRPWRQAQWYIPRTEPCEIIAGALGLVLTGGT
ncbi:MAG: hypothetical protein J7556_00770 [Acidovorax sp.]|nr:hypothetical protein [Acidovorax sp.]